MLIDISTRRVCLGKFGWVIKTITLKAVISGYFWFSGFKILHWTQSISFFLYSFTPLSKGVFVALCCADGCWTQGLMCNSQIFYHSSMLLTPVKDIYHMHTYMCSLGIWYNMFLSYSSSLPQLFPDLPLLLSHPTLYHPKWRLICSAQIFLDSVDFHWAW